jgi:type III secretion protein SpaR/YscT/HrcT
MPAPALDSYSAILNTHPLIPPSDLLSLFLLTFARLVPIVVFAPFLGAKVVPAPVRIMFCISLAYLFFPANLLLIKGSVSAELYTWIFVKEMFIGAILGLLATVPFYVAQMSGTLIDQQRGSSSLQVTDPSTQSQTSSIGVLYNSLLIVIFFLLNGPFLFFDSVALSYQLIPVDQFINPLFFDKSSSFWHQIFQLLQFMMALAVQLAAPALIAILFTDLFLGIANRLAPQVQIVFLGMSLKSWVAILILCASWALILKVLGQESILWIKTLSKLINKVILS